MTSNRSSYTFITIPSSVVSSAPGPSALSAATTPAATAVIFSEDVIAAADSPAGAHTAPAAAGFTPPPSAAATACMSSPAEAAVLAAPTQSAASSPRFAAAAATYPPTAGAGAAMHGAPRPRAERHLGARNKVMLTAVPLHKASLLAEVASTRSKARIAPPQRKSFRGRGRMGEEQQKQTYASPSLLAAGAAELPAAQLNPAPTSSSALRAPHDMPPRDGVGAPRSEDCTTASSVSASRYSPTLLGPGQWLPSPQSPFSSRLSDPSSPCMYADRAAAGICSSPPAGRQHEHGAATQRRNSERKNMRKITVPLFTDAVLPPLAVEDAAVMLREFAGLLRRLESTGQQVLLQEKQPESLHEGNEVRRRFCPHEQLRQQAVICSSLSARLQQLFEASATQTAQPTSPESPVTISGTAVDDTSQKKPRHQLLLPGVRSRAALHETGSGEEQWPENGASNRIALRTVGTFSTVGSNSSISFELAQAYSPPLRSSPSALEHHRGRLRIAKLKEDFERLQQKHERLVTLFNIRMLLPLSRRSSAGNSVENPSVTLSPRRGPAAERSVLRDKKEVETPARARIAVQTPRLRVGDRQSMEGATAVAAGAGARKAAVLQRRESAAADENIFSALDFSHFVPEHLGACEGRRHSQMQAARMRRRHSSCVPFGPSSAWTPLHALSRYTSSNSNSSSEISSGRHHGHRFSVESGYSTFYSLNDLNSFSFGDALLPPIRLGPVRESEADRGIDNGGSASRRASLLQQVVQEQGKARPWDASTNRKTEAGLGTRWGGESSLLLPGEASLENLWRPTRLQEIEEGFEEQQRREQLQQLQHIEECVHVLQELHVQVADEVEAADEPLAAVATETNAAALQTGQAKRELVTASLRRSRWWGVQGGGVAAAAGVVVGGLAAGPIGAAVGLIFGAFVGATSGSALEREHRHKLLQLIREKKRRKQGRASCREQGSQQRTASQPVFGTHQRAQVHGREHELVYRARDWERGDRDRETQHRSERLSSGRLDGETWGAHPKRRIHSSQHGRTAGQPFNSSATLPQRRGARRQKRSTSTLRETELQRSDEPNRSSSATVSKSKGTPSERSAGAVGSSHHSCRRETASSGSRVQRAAASSRENLHSTRSIWTDNPNANACNRRRGDQCARKIAARQRRGECSSPNIPLPALLGWGKSSVWRSRTSIRDAVDYTSN